MTDKKEFWIEVRIPVQIYSGNGGLFYATSPLLKGLLVAEHTHEEARAAVRKAVDDLGEVAMQEQLKLVCSAETIKKKATDIATSRLATQKR